MKILLGVILMASFAYAASTIKDSKVSPEALTAQKSPKDSKVLKMLDKKEEDCDEKAKKPIEITPESISLSGNTGCSLDEAH